MLAAIGLALALAGAPPAEQATVSAAKAPDQTLDLDGLSWAYLYSTNTAAIFVDRPVPVEGHQVIRTRQEFFEPIAGHLSVLQYVELDCANNVMRLMGGDSFARHNLEMKVDTFYGEPSPHSVSDDRVFRVGCGKTAQPQLVLGSISVKRPAGYAGPPATNPGPPSPLASAPSAVIAAAPVAAVGADLTFELKGMGWSLAKQDAIGVYFIKRRKDDVFPDVWWIQTRLERFRPLGITASSWSHDAVRCTDKAVLPRSFWEYRKNNLEDSFGIQEFPSTDPFVRPKPDSAVFAVLDVVCGATPLAPATEALLTFKGPPGSAPVQAAAPSVAPPPAAAPGPRPAPTPAPVAAAQAPGAPGSGVPLKPNGWSVAFQNKDGVFYVQQPFPVLGSRWISVRFEFSKPVNGVLSSWGADEIQCAARTVTTRSRTGYAKHNLEGDSRREQVSMVASAVHAAPNTVAALEVDLACGLTPLPPLGNTIIFTPAP